MKKLFPYKAGIVIILHLQMWTQNLRNSLALLHTAGGKRGSDTVECKAHAIRHSALLTPAVAWLPDY